MKKRTARMKMKTEEDEEEDREDEEEDSEDEDEDREEAAAGFGSLLLGLEIMSGGLRAPRGPSRLTVRQ
ncbi:hypothetical protein AMECASPLE_017047 [Ameca splendens]|uniref:Uncharacterized protein n=1 Tax=Ameca splendens TaxID=208324 RepID=A0ABV0ZC24_9TELE